MFLRRTGLSLTVALGKCKVNKPGPKEIYRSQAMALPSQMHHSTVELT